MTSSHSFSFFFAALFHIYTHSHGGDESNRRRGRRIRRLSIECSIAAHQIWFLDLLLMSIFFCSSVFLGDGRDIGTTQAFAARLVQCASIVAIQCGRKYCNDQRYAVQCGETAASHDVGPKVKSRMEFYQQTVRKSLCESQWMRCGGRYSRLELNPHVRIRQSDFFRVQKMHIIFPSHFFESIYQIQSFFFARKRN